MEQTEDMAKFTYFLSKQGEWEGKQTEKQSPEKKNISTWTLPKWIQ